MYLLFLRFSCEVQQLMDHDDVNTRDHSGVCCFTLCTSAEASQSEGTSSGSHQPTGRVCLTSGFRPFTAFKILGCRRTFMLAEVVPLSIRGRGRGSEADERATLMLVLRGWGKGTWPEHNTLGKVLTVESTGKKASHIESTS